MLYVDIVLNVVTVLYELVVDLLVPVARVVSNVVLKVVCVLNELVVDLDVPVLAEVSYPVL